MHRRHTNFAVESIEQPFTGNINFARKTQCILNRNGDLVSQTFLKIITPEVRYNAKDFTNFGYVQFAWVRRLGHAIIDELEFDIGGTLVDKQYGLWLNLWYEVCHDVGKEEGYAKMIGDVPELTKIDTLSWDNEGNTILKPAYTMYVPLQFYYMRNNGLALPLIALQYHDVKLTVKFKPVDQLYIASDAFTCGAEQLNIEDSSLYVNYVYLDNAERKRFAQASHEYLIEQLQFTGEETITGATAKVQIRFNHPVKALYWVTILGNYQGGKFMVYEPYDWELARENAAKLILLSQYDLDDYGYFNTDLSQREYYGKCGESYEVIDVTDPAEGSNFIFNDNETADRFSGSSEGPAIPVGRLPASIPLLKKGKLQDYKDKVEGVIRIFSDYASEGYYYPEVERITRNDITIADLSIPVSEFDIDNRNSYIKRLDLYVWQHHNYGLYIDGSFNPVTQVQLQLNGQDRQTKRTGFWHDVVEPWAYFHNSPVTGVNVFSFALNPTEYQPSGTCNFSRIDIASLNLWFEEFAHCLGAIAGNNNRVYLFGVNYNVLRIMSGMAGLAYAN
jgi:Large eukaryotic DNA virus major capsid protein/Major capsid protein N-terminus